MLGWRRARACETAARPLEAPDFEDHFSKSETYGALLVVKRRFSAEERFVLSLALVSGPRAFGLTLMAVSAFGLWWEGRAAATTGAPAPQTAPGVPGMARAAPTSGNPLGQLRFEANVGQLDDQVRFQARGGGFGLYLTRDGATVALKHRATDEPMVVSMHLVGARSVEPSAEGQLAGRSNYDVGSDKSKWTSGVSSYARVRYPELLPNVDVIYYGSQERELEYDIVVRPGADPRALQVALEGLSSLELAQDGDALLGLPDGSVLHKRRPVAYQLDEQGVKSFVVARFRKLSPDRLGFEVGPFDAGRPLVIDPTLSYASYLGGSRFDEFSAVAATSTGETYAVGYTTGTLFPTRSAAQGTYGGGASDAVICKVKADGTGLVYATYLGGNDADRAYGIALDPTGAAYVVGVTQSTAFPAAHPLQAYAGGQDAFVAKLSDAGALIYSTTLGGGGDDYAQAVAVSPSGEAYVVGTTFSVAGPGGFPTAAPLQAVLSGTSDAFVSRLTFNASTLALSLTYSTFLGGAGVEYGHGVALDGSGNAYVVGETSSSNFATPSAAQASLSGSSDAFVSKLSPTGSALTYWTYLGGTSSSDVATGVALVGGAAVVVGYTSSASGFPHANAAQATFGGGSSDAFVTRVGAAGSSFDFSTYVGGSGADSASAVAVDANGFIYVTGQTASSDFPLELPLTGQSSLQGPSDAFLTAFSAGATQLYSTYLGGTAADAGVGVAMSKAPPTLHLLGNTFSNNFPTTVGSMFSSQLGPQDGFIARLPVVALTPAPSTQPLTLLLLVGLLLGAGLLALSFRAPSYARPHAGE